MFSFERLHTSKKLAYLDGVLCGILIAAIGAKIYKDWKEEREYWRRVDEDIKKNESTEVFES